MVGGEINREFGIAYTHCLPAQSLSCVRLFGTLCTLALQASLLLELFGQLYWSELPFPSPRDLPNPGIETESPVSLALQADSLQVNSLPAGPSGILQYTHCCCIASVTSNSMRPSRRQLTRLLCPWDSPGKNAGVGCHFLLKCMHAG